MKDLRDYGAWALITGASSGIGEHFARALAAGGLNCVLVARRLDRLEQLASELADKHGVQCLCIEQDLSEDGCVQNIAERTEELDVGVLVNNAGFGCCGDFETSDAQRLEDLVKVNCLAPVSLTREFLPKMVERKRGAVIIVSSLLGFLPAPYDACYGASKAFDLHFGEALWAEMRPKGIDVITVCPSATSTEFFEAEGRTAEQSRRISRIATRPEKIVSITLRNIGRKPTVGPMVSKLPAFLTRFLPRKLVVLLTGFGMRKTFGAN